MPDTSPDRNSAPEILPATARVIKSVREHGPVSVAAGELLNGDGLLDCHEDVLKKDLFQVRFNGRQLVLQARGHVGLIPINDRLALNVEPRVPIRSLERMLIVAGTNLAALEGHQRAYALHEDQPESLLAMLATSLLRCVDEIRLHGKLHEYVCRQEATAFPRGRILMGETCRRQTARGVHHRVEASWHELSFDTASDRCIKFAVWTLIQTLPHNDNRGLLSRLNQAMSFFGNVQLDHSRDFLRDPLVADPHRLPATHAHYHDALRVAVAIIKRRGVRLRGQDGVEVVLNTLLIDLDKVFEDYLRAVLRAQAAVAGVALEVRDGNDRDPLTGGAKALFENAAGGEALPFPRKVVMATPDIILKPKAPAGVSTPLVIEVKYKPLDGKETADREDVNQAIAYGVSYGASTVVLVHPAGGKRGPPKGLSLVGRLPGLVVCQYVFDLNATELRAEEQNFARALFALCLAGDPTSSGIDVALP